MLALIVSAAFAISAFHSPIKSIPAISPSTIPGCGLQDVVSGAGSPAGGTATRCEALEAEAQAQFVPSFHLYQTYAELAEAFAAVSVLCLLFPRLRAPRLLLRPIRLPPRARRGLLFLVALCAFVFVAMALIDATYRLSGVSRQIVEAFHFQSFQTQGGAFGTVAFSLLAVAVVAMTLRDAGSGFWPSFELAFTRLGGAATLILMIGLLAFDSNEMPIHATNFTVWSWAGVYLLSNWFVLVLASFLALLGFSPLLLNRQSRGSIP